MKQYWYLHSDSSESGVTLVELLMYAMLSSIVLFVAGGMLIAGVKTQENSRMVTDASAGAQQIVHSIGTGVANATAVSLANGTVAGSQLLMVRTIGSDPATTVYACQAWYFTPLNAGAIYTMQRTPAAPITLQTSGGPEGGIWTLMASGVSAGTSGKVFGPPLVAHTHTVILDFLVSAGSHPSVLINTTLYTPQSAVVGSPCF